MFCKLKGFEQLGFAKIVDEDANHKVIEYFDAPFRTEVKRVNHSDIVPGRLGFNSRTYVSNNGLSWSVGRVQLDDGEGVEIRLQGGQDIYETYDHVFVRWRKPISDPFEFLSSGITETPRYAKARNAFRDSYIQQRGKTGGLSALLSSTIELVPHQIDVVQRVLRDPAQRYLLADEVGLGKTIEAGVIIRQSILDNIRDHKIVVVVPASLVNQWRTELSSRFGLSPYLDISLYVIATNNIAALSRALTNLTFLVVDEAHHVAEPTEEAKLVYKLISAAARASPRLLLLSATPILRNESGFLRMLHLLDPVVYPLDNESDFRNKIFNRQFLAEAVAAIDPENILQLEPVLDDLERLLPGDLRLRDLSATVKSHLRGRLEADEALTGALRTLRGYLSETYRLHRRILRNRRRRVIGLTPKRAGCKPLFIKSPFRRLLEDELETWRINALASTHGELPEASAAFRSFYWNAMDFIAVSAVPCVELCARRLAAISGGVASRSFDGETQLLRSIQQIVASEAEFASAKIDALIANVPGLIAEGRKCIVFCTHASVADEVFLKASTGLRPIHVYRHSPDPDMHGSWRSFLDLREDTVLVCDERAEEGLNLQGGRKAIIHFDLPMNPNRIEQRLGRVDRFGSGDPIESIVIVADTPLQRAWYAVISDGLRVCDRSVSSLQYLIDEQMHDVQRDVFLRGVESLTSLLNDLKGDDGLVERELRLIDQQDSLDELEPVPENAIEAIAAVDDDWRRLQAAMDEWAIETLMFEVADRQPGTQLAAPFRFRYVPPGNGRATLIPLAAFLDDFLGAVDYEAPGGGARRPLSYAHSYRRQTAIGRKVRVLRYGTEFVEALKTFADTDDRGRTYATWRCVPEKSPVKGHAFYFQVCFLIEGDPKGGNPAAVSSIANREGNPTSVLRAIGRRIDSNFPPFLVGLWLDEEGQLVQPDFVESYLTVAPADVATSGWSDKNLKAARFTKAIHELPDIFGSWRDRCNRMREAAFGHLKESAVYREAVRLGIGNASNDRAAREAYHAARLRHCNDKDAISEDEDFAREMSICDIVGKALSQPTITIDVVGVVVLSEGMCPIVEASLVNA
jgi:ATP-dependent helicase HepA